MATPTLNTNEPVNTTSPEQVQSVNTTEQAPLVVHNEDAEVEVHEQDAESAALLPSKEEANNDKETSTYDIGNIRKINKLRYC